MKKFFDEFKTFISRGNVVDMAVGVIIGGAFSTIVTALSTNILQPLINYIIALRGSKDNALESAVTILKATYDNNGSIDLSSSIYINWGAFISSILNFILIALILFIIVRTINRINDNVKSAKEENKMLTIKEKKALIKEGKSLKEIKQIQKLKLEELKKLKEEEEKKNIKPTSEELLQQILETIKNDKK